MQNTPIPETYSFTEKKAVNVGTDFSKILQFPYSLTGSTFQCKIYDKSLTSNVVDFDCSIDIGDSKLLLITCDRSTIATAIGTDYGDYIIRLFQTDSNDDKFMIFQGTINFYK